MFKEVYVWPRDRMTSTTSHPLVATIMTSQPPNAAATPPTSHCDVDDYIF
ncbi:hypothetical protein D8674_023928 [Pyrus ussuriensis x Pyrus communis]|uniref:Uncharacterized protein n=1 Tax=Pyrus ussuriensis x Pyrus communis TaxID=2448454 RepID=A0A5N5H1J3_9ROSA|nr:hypothetical protein D8674_023928 [Pyrus ussuriensis x Pyrus communis]